MAEAADQLVLGGPQARVDEAIMAAEAAEATENAHRRGRGGRGGGGRGGGPDEPAGREGAGRGAAAVAVAFAARGGGARGRAHTDDMTLYRVDDAEDAQNPGTTGVRRAPETGILGGGLDELEAFMTRMRVLAPTLTDADILAQFNVMKASTAGAPKRERQDESDAEFVDRHLMVEKAKIELRRQEKERQLSDPLLMVYTPTVDLGVEIDVSIVYLPIICTTLASYDRVSKFRGAVKEIVTRVHPVMYQIAPHDSRKRHHEYELTAITEIGELHIERYDVNAPSAAMAAWQNKAFSWMKKFLGLVLAIQKASGAVLCEKIIDTKAAITPLGNDTIRDADLRARRQGAYWNLVYRQASADFKKLSASAEDDSITAAIRTIDNSASTSVKAPSGSHVASATSASRESHANQGGEGPSH